MVTNIFRHKFIILLFFFCLVFITYRYLLNSFFQQDEWVSLGTVLGGGMFAELNKFSVWQLAAGYVRVFGTLLNNSYHYFFPLNPFPFALTAILFHTMNSFLVFWFAEKITENRFIAVLSGIFFAIAHAHHQALSWFAAVTTTLPSLFLSLISLILIVRQPKRSLIFISQILLIISFLFKESTLVFFPLLPLIWVCTTKIKKGNTFQKFRLFLPIFLYLLYIILVRFYLFATVDKRGAFVTRNSNGGITLVQNIVVYPIIGFSQEYVPYQYLYPLSDKVFALFKNTVFKKINLEEVHKLLLVRDIISSIFSLLLIFAFFFLLGLYQQKKLPVIISLLLFLVCFIPFAILDRGESYFDSRYYYTSSVGASIIFAFSVYVLVEFFIKRKKIFHLGVVIIIVIAFGYLYKNVSLTRAVILQNNVEAEERKNLLISLRSYFPKLQNDPIFYVTGDSIGYYGVAEQKVPFQQGFGYTLMVYYYDTNVIPHELLVDWYKLWDMRFEGYWKYNMKGFGYFWSYEELKKALKDNAEISPNNVYALYWHSSDKYLENITEQTRDRLYMEIKQN